MNWKFHAPLTSLMDMITPLRGEKWFLFGLLLVIFISTGFAEEDGKTNTTSKGFPSIKSMAKSFSNTVDSFFKKTVSIFKGSPHQNNTESTTSSPSNEIKNTTMPIKPVSPENPTLPGKIEEKPDKVADDKSVADNKSSVDDGNSTTVP